MQCYLQNEHGEVCPAGWAKGDEGMKANTAGVAEYLAKTKTNYNNYIIGVPLGIPIYLTNC